MVAGEPGFWCGRGGTDAGAEHVSDWIVPKKMTRQRNLTEPGTKTAYRSSLPKCSNLERGESMKDPVSIFGCWRGFQFAERLASLAHPSAREVQLPISALLARIRKLIPKTKRPSLRRDRPRFRGWRVAQPRLAHERRRT